MHTHSHHGTLTFARCRLDARWPAAKLLIARAMRVVDTCTQVGQSPDANSRSDTEQAAGWERRRQTSRATVPPYLSLRVATKQPQRFAVVGERAPSVTRSVFLFGPKRRRAGCRHLPKGAGVSLLHEHSTRCGELAS